MIFRKRRAHRSACITLFYCECCNMSRLTIDLSDNDHAADIRRMTGQPDPDWVKMAFAVYWLLLSESSDNVVRIIRENDQVASVGLTREAVRILRGVEQ
jgi:hypothetical protein